MSILQSKALLSTQQATGNRQPVTWTQELQHTNWYVKRWLAKKNIVSWLQDKQEKIYHKHLVTHSSSWVNTTLFNTRKCTCTLQAHAEWIAYGLDECVSCTIARSYLITGLDCRLDHWTGLLDWITGLTFELDLCVPHDLHPIRCAKLGHTFDA